MVEKISIAEISDSRSRVLIALPHILLHCMCNQVEKSEEKATTLHQTITRKAEVIDKATRKTVLFTSLYNILLVGLYNSLHKRLTK